MEIAQRRLSDKNAVGGRTRGRQSSLYKLVFPNDVNKKWLGNKLITIPPPYIIDTSNYFLNDWKYTIKNRDAYYDNGTLIFDSTLLVSQIQDSSAITKTYSVERFARSVALIFFASSIASF